MMVGPDGASSSSEGGRPSPARPHARRARPHRRRRPGGAPVDDVSFEVPARRDRRHRRRAGQRPDRAVEALLGLRPDRCAGRSRLNGRDLTARRRPGSISTPGSRYVPEDRQEDGLVGDFTRRRQSGARPYHDGRPSPRASACNLGAYRRQRGPSGSRSSTSAPPRAQAPVGTLSGGNQQKVILARELSASAEGAHRLAAHPRARRRLHRVRAPSHRDQRDNGVARAHRLAGTRRDLRPRGPDRGHVRRAHRRFPAAGGAGGGARPADGGRYRSGPGAGFALAGRLASGDPPESPRPSGPSGPEASPSATGIPGAGEK